MVSRDGVVKVIDLGFGKKVATVQDFDRSIDLNWWCQTPDEFRQRLYDFCTEVYFVGKLFEAMVDKLSLGSFPYLPLLGKMCQTDPNRRVARFADVEREMGAASGAELSFSGAERERYRNFADAISQQITQLEFGVKYVTDITLVMKHLREAYRSMMLEDCARDCAPILRCLVGGNFWYRKTGFPVDALKGFVELLEGASEEKRHVLMANVHAALDAKPRKVVIEDDDVPF